MSLSLVDFFNLDSKDFEWQKIAPCRSYEDPDLFFEAYEEDDQTARVVDQICLHCPVVKQCFASGVKGKEVGVWGGVYLKNGKYDRDQNSHKDTDVLKELSALHGRRF